MSKPLNNGSKSNKWRFTKPPQQQPEFIVDKEELKKRLTPLQYRVTQDKITERPFSGKYLKLKDNGRYACVVCNEELFSSESKYESSCGWPAFYDVKDIKKVRLAPDLSHVGSNLLLLAIKPDLVRTEVSCGNCSAHLGHLFDDGPKPTGKRFCINSAALTFKKQDADSSCNFEAPNLKRSQSESISTVVASPSNISPLNDIQKHNEINQTMSSKPKSFSFRTESNQITASTIQKLRSNLRPIKSSPPYRNLLETHL